MTAHEELERLAHDQRVRLSVWMGSLTGDAWLTRDADAVHAAASTLKLPLLVAVRRAIEAGELAEDEQLDVHADFASVVEHERYVVTPAYDNDPQVWERLGGTASVGWLAERAIVRSSNLATNLLIERVGRAAVDAVYADAGARHSALRRGIQDAPASAAWIFNETTAADTAGVLCALPRLVRDPAAVERVLARCEDDDALPAGLPPGTYVAHKPGWIDEACHDVGLVRPEGEEPFVLAIYSTGQLAEAPFHALVARAARICWDHRHERPRTVTP